MVSSTEEIVDVAASYFNDLFSSSATSNASVIFDNVCCRVTPAMNTTLSSPFNRREVWDALRSMSPLKAPGTDGFPVLFYQKYWSIIGDEVTNYCLAVLNGEIDIATVNKTHIVLIPKIKKPRNMSHFRPISLCNVLYKIITKMLVIRMKDVLGVCIDEAQGAFVPGRQISDNVLIAYEILHGLKQKRSGKEGTFALKLDMSKAYDRVEWDFVEGMMARLGFCDSWISIIKKCIRSVSYTVGANGTASDVFFPTRGLRQGDPLSPYLFLFCTEGFSTVLNNAKTSGVIKGARVGRERLAINRLFFADDSILFGEASDDGARRIQAIIEQYTSASGQQVNFDKSLLFFSSNVPSQLQDAIGLTLGVRISSNLEKYLGLPTMVGRRKKEAFCHYLDRFNKLTDHWNIRNLSKGGKEVFVKSVLQAIPIYAMQCFLLPKSLCIKLESAMNRFWWKNSASTNGIHWCSWAAMATPKFLGGMGFRNLAKFNVALLAKQGWRIITHPSSLLAKVMKARYFPRSDFMSARLGSNPSYTWRSIFSAKGLLEKGLRWSIGTGSNVNIWNDSWLSGKGNGRILDQPIDIRYTKVADLTNPSSNTWDIALVQSLFAPNIADRILCIPIARTKPSDEIVWGMDGSGYYSPKSGYRLLLEENLQDSRGNTVYCSMAASEFFKNLWKLAIPSKCKIFFWRLFHNYLPTLSNLQQRRIQVGNSCPFCDAAAESIEHFLYGCTVSIQLLHALHITVPNPSIFPNYKSWLINLFNSFHQAHRTLIVITYWALWFARNQLFHDGKRQTIVRILAFIHAHIAEIQSVADINPPPMPPPSSWSPPAPGIIKINFGTSFVSDKREAFTGIIARNSLGLIMAACILPLSAINDAFIAEAKACEAAITFAIELGFRSIQVEGDSLAVIKKLSSSSSDKSIIRPIISDIKSTLVLFEKITFSHVGRRGNEAAHVLAQAYSRFQLPCYWIEDAPSDVEQVALRDLHQ
ncbi:hypothetical protein GQ457_07G036340 [Hibiscus cannabinus]